MNAFRHLRLLSVTALVIAAAVAAGPVRAEAATPPTGLHVSGNQLLDSSGRAVVLRGVNRSGTEYQCIHGYGIFDGPSDDASIAAMAAWKINAVRVPLNEDCWLNINGAPASYSGAAYQSAITDYVNRLHAAGLVAILDLHWTAAGGSQAQGQQNMPDADHAPAFWTSVANAFKNDGSTVFDLYNEPHDVSWTCWRDGGDCGLGYQVAGMQTLVTTVRATGATNPVLLGGLAYSNDLTSWLAYKPSGTNVMASWHSYNFNTCVTTSCWDGQIAPVAASVPVVTGEAGENDCAHGYLDGLLPWLDRHGIGYLGWGWDTFDCSSFPALISNYDGTPTNFGIGLRDHLASLTTPTAQRLTVTPSANTSNAPTSWEDDLDLGFGATTTALTVTIKVASTGGVHGTGSSSTNAAVTVAVSGLKTTATLSGGQTLARGSTVRIAVKYTGSGAAHPTSGDTFVVKATVGGQALSRTGHF